MIQRIFVYGIVAGVIVGVPLSIMGSMMGDGPPPAWGMAVGYLTMLIALSTIFVAIKRTRDHEGGGVIRFWPAFGLGLGISVVASLCYVLAWEVTLAATGMDFGGDYARLLIEAERAKGVSGAALAKFTADMEAFAVQYRNPLYRMPLSFIEIFPVGLLVSLVSAALLRNPRFLPLRRTAIS